MIALYIILCLVYGWFARMDGGAPPKVNEWVERLLCISVFTYTAWTISQDWWTLVSLLGIFGLATGHGTYFLNRMVKAVEHERLDFLVRPFFGADPRANKKYKAYRGSKWNSAPKSIRVQVEADMHAYGYTKLYWRNVFGMFVTGSLVGIPTAILAVVYGAYIDSIFIACTGFAKSFAYMAGYFMYKKGWLQNLSTTKIGKYLNHDTAMGEYLNGVLRTALCFTPKLF